MHSQFPAPRRPQPTIRKRALNLLLIFLLAVPGVTARPPVQAAGDEIHLSNEALRLTLYGGGLFSLISSDGRPLLFPGGTSYASVWVDGTAYTSSLLNLASGQLISQEMPPWLVDDVTAQERFVTAEGVHYTFSYTLVGPAVRFSVLAENRGGDPHAAQVRFLLDTQVDENDGSPLWASGSVYTEEAEAPRSTSIFKGYDQIPAPEFVSTGLLVTPPQRVAFVHWPTAHQSSWDYSTDPSRSFYTPGYTRSPESDSAVLLYYDLGQLDPGASAEAEFYYGLAAPEGSVDLDTLLLELDLVRAALEARLEADLDRLIEIHTRSYQAVYGHQGPSTLLSALTSGSELSAAEIHFALEGDPSGLATSGAELAGELMLGSIRESTRSAIEEALPAIYRDLNLPPDAPNLAQELRHRLNQHLGVDDLRREIGGQFASLEQTLRQTGLPEDYAIDAVVNALRAYRSQLELTGRQEALLTWPDPALGTMAFRPSGLLVPYARFSQGLEPVDALAGGLKWTGYAIGVGATVKLVAALATAGSTALLEGVVIATGAVAGTAFSLGGGQVEEAAVEAHAYAAIYSAIVAGGELELLQDSAGDLLSAVEGSLTDATGWKAQGAVRQVSLEDIILESGETVGTGRGSVTVHNTGTEAAPAVIYATILGPVGTGRAPIAILGQPDPVVVGPGEQAEIQFEYGAPDTQVWHDASGYPVDLWVALGYRLVHVSDDPTLAQELQVLVGSREAVGALRLGTTLVIHAGELGENQSSRREITIDRAMAITTLDLSYGGSDFDLHLYDPQGGHVGLNYDTGQIELGIAGVSYSGPASRPEWVQIEGHGGETFQLEVIAIQAEAPEHFTVVSRGEPALPGLLGVDPVEVMIPEQLSQTTAVRFPTYEYGGHSGVIDLSAWVELLEAGDGGALPAQGAWVTAPAALEAGGSAEAELTLDRNAFRPGTYTGRIHLAGTDANSGSPIQTSAPFWLFVAGTPDQEPGSDDQRPGGEGGGGGGLGLGVAILVAAVAAVAVYGLARKGRRRAGPDGRSPARRTNLAILSGPGTGRLIPLTGATFSIGREPGSTLRLEGRAVSRHHAHIRYSQGRWFIQDQGSLHGTAVNGRPVSAAELRHGDRVTIGDTVFEFRMN